MIKKFLLVLFLVLSISCNNNQVVSDSDPELLEISIDSGNNQYGYQNTILPNPVIIHIVNDNEIAQNNVEVILEVLEGDGEVVSVSRTTNENGNLEIIWKLGYELNQVLQASIKEDPSININCYATTLYLYNIPNQINDGWNVRQLDTSQVQVKNMLFLVDSIRMNIYPEIHSILIVHNNEIVLEEYFAGHNSQGEFIEFNMYTPHDVQSASKSFRSALIGIAIDNGFIPDENTNVVDLLSLQNQFDDSLKNEITLEHILTMSSGLYWTENELPFDHPNNTLSYMYSLPYDEWSNYVLSQPIDYPPGSTWEYNTGASILLNQILIESTRMPLEIFVRNYYSDLINSNLVPGIGNPLGNKTTPRDMAKLGYIYLNDGMWNNYRIISEEWITKSTTNSFQIYNDGTSYGYQWWLRTFTSNTNTYDCFYASGNGGQYIFIIKELDLVLVFTGGNFGIVEMYNPFLVVDKVINAFED